MYNQATSLKQQTGWVQLCTGDSIKLTYITRNEPRKFRLEGPVSLTNSSTSSTKATGHTRAVYCGTTTQIIQHGLVGNSLHKQEFNSWIPPQVGAQPQAGAQLPPSTSSFPPQAGAQLPPSTSRSLTPSLHKQELNSLPPQAGAQLPPSTSRSSTPSLHKQELNSLPPQAGA